MEIQHFTPIHLIFFKLIYNEVPGTARLVILFIVFNYV